MPVRQVIVGKLWVPRDDVAAVVELIIWVAKQHPISCNAMYTWDHDKDLQIKVVGVPFIIRCKSYS